MSDAPERIKLQREGVGFSPVWRFDVPRMGVNACFVRKDLHDAALARVVALEAAIEYILDGMGIDGPDYLIDPDEDYMDAVNSESVRDVMVRLSAALNKKDAKP